MSLMVFQVLSVNNSCGLCTHYVSHNCGNKPQGWHLSGSRDNSHGNMKVLSIDLQSK